MSGLSCPNCGLSIGQGAYNHEGVLYCCQGCAERTYCFCRVTAPNIVRIPVTGATPR